MKKGITAAIALALPLAASAAEYLEKTPFQLSRAFSPGVVTAGGKMVWVAGQTATRDNAGNDIANNFEAQVKQVVSQIDQVMKRAGGSLANVVSMTVFIKESRYGDRFVEMRKDMFQNGNYPGSALITVTNFARPGIEIEIQAIGVIGDRAPPRARARPRARRRSADAASARSRNGTGRSVRDARRRAAGRGARARADRETARRHQLRQLGPCAARACGRRAARRVGRPRARAARSAGVPAEFRLL